MRTLVLALLTLAVSGSPLPLGAQAARSPRVACAPGNGGLSLPEGLCAVVVGRDLSPVRHVVVAPRDTTGDGVADVIRRFGEGGIGIALGPDDALYVSIDSGTNSCQERESGDLWGAVHGRDQLAQNWGFADRKSAENPDLNTKVLAPEYGSDGKAVGRCAKPETPVAAYPGHWAPMAVAFGRSGALGDAYADGAFSAFHGSWSRAPRPQAGYRLVSQPLAGGKPSKPFTTFATGTIWRLMRPPDAQAQAGAAPQGEGPAVGEPAPDFALIAATREGVSPRPVRLSDFKGQTVVLAFFFKARTKG